MTRLIAYFESLNKFLDDIEIKEILDSYNDWVEHQPSIIDGDSRTSKPHHLRTCNNAGTGIKPIDLYKVPITYAQHSEHHTAGKYQQVFIDKLPELHERFLDETCIFYLKHRVEGKD